MTADCTSGARVDQWTTAYNLRSKLRCAPGLVAKLKNPTVSDLYFFLIQALTERSQQEGRLLFCAYVGALCIQSGYNVVQDWINQLLEPSEKRAKNEPPPLSVPSPLPQRVDAPANIGAASLARFRSQFATPDTPTFSQPSPRASQPPPYISGSNNPFSNGSGSLPVSVGSPSKIQPPPPTTKPPPLPPTPNHQQISFLPLFNQTASQRRLGVEYTAQFFGPPHAGKWHVKCIGGCLPHLPPWRPFGIGLCWLTTRSISPQSTTSRRVRELDRASKLPRRRLLNRPSMPWDGQPRSVVPFHASVNALTTG